MAFTIWPRNSELHNRIIPDQRRLDAHTSKKEGSSSCKQIEPNRTEPNRTEGFLHKTLHAAPPRETDESVTRRSTEDEIEAEIATRREDEEDDDDGGGGGDNNDDDDDDDDN